MNENISAALYKKGLIYAIACAVLWGILPIYWQALRPIESSVIIFYRIFLVGLVCLILSLKLYGLEEMKIHLKRQQKLFLPFLKGVAEISPETIRSPISRITLEIVSQKLSHSGSVYRFCTV